MKVLIIDGIEYDQDFIINLIEDMNQLRNGALNSGRMDFAVVISHCIAVLNHYKDSI